MSAEPLQILVRFPDRVNHRRLRRPTMRRAKPRWPGSLLSQRAATGTRDDRCSSFNRSKENRKSKHNARRGNLNNSRRDSE